MADREEDDLQMALRISLQGSPPEAKRSEPRESVKESPETRNRRVQRELMAAAEKRIGTAGGKIVSSPKPRVETVGRKVAAAGTSVSRSKEVKAKEEELVVKVEKVEKFEEGRELDLGEELAPEVMDHLFSMVFGSDASRDILAQWSNQGIRFSTDPETRMGLVQHEGGPVGSWQLYRRLSSRAQGRLKKTWMEVIRQDMEAKGLSECILLDRNEWRKLIHVPDPA